jgi:hypothetical protein
MVISQIGIARRGALIKSGNMERKGVASRRKASTNYPLQQKNELLLRFI